MRPKIGSQVKLPNSDKEGLVLDIRENPACFIRTLVVQWKDGDIEELEELEFGPLEDNEEA